MKYSELYKILERDGWYIDRTKRHYIYIHPTKKGIIPVGRHSSEEVKSGTLNSILKLAGLK
ncbi:MAG: type II toxin-antitoxin system HicA family toxin [Prolixibacteraceae bacterium]|nr:type II toxin-antitoxin system HicA family toxin [Prolixibacteraceae bacterium]